jgi:hypothetical protein
LSSSAASTAWSCRASVLLTQQAACMARVPARHLGSSSCRDHKLTLRLKTATTGCMHGCLRLSRWVVQGLRLYTHVTNAVMHVARLISRRVRIFEGLKTRQLSMHAGTAATSMERGGPSECCIHWAASGHCHTAVCVFTDCTGPR